VAVLEVKGSTIQAIDLPWTIPPLTVENVDAQRMKTMAALLRDPYPIHWDPAAVRAAGHGDRPVNQGPLNLAYIANMLMAWAGDGSIRRLTVAFHSRVLAGDRVTASGEVVEIGEADGERRATCAVRLRRDEELIVSGTALVRLGPADPVSGRGAVA
jgi:acyl dehydratase